MINFIICDNLEWIKVIKAVIDNYMMNFDIEVKYHLIENYNKFEDKIKSIKGFKVFIFNCDSKKDYGVAQAKYIREKLEDWNSIIILITEHNEMKNEVIGKRLFLFDFISKKNHFEKILKEDLSNILKYYGNRDNCLTFESNRIIKKIDFKNINMIQKEKDSKRCIIKASHGSYYIPESLNRIETRLDNRFIKINRSCIVNSDDILEFDLNENKITLNSGDVSFDISRECKKNISNYFNRYK